MKDEDYIRKAVSLADGWDITENSAITIPNGGDNWFVDWPMVYLNDWPDYGLQFVVDALAAQLVRQVDAIEAPKHPDRPSAFYSTPHECQVWMRGKVASVKTADDRTMNTIKAIIDSKVLE